MDDLLQKIITTLVTLIISIVVIYFGWELLSHTPIGKGLNQFLGGVGAVLGSVGEQLDKCSDNGFFSSGCYIGWFGVAIFGAWVVSGIGQFITSNKLLSRYQAETGKSFNDAVQDTRKYCESKGVDWDKIDEADPTGITAGKVAANGALNMTIDQINSQGYSPIKATAEIEAARTQWANANNDINDRNGLDENSAKQYDDAAKDWISPDV